MQDFNQVQLKVLDTEFFNKFELPNYATTGSAGIDLRACIKQDLVIKAGETKLIPTGLSIYIANQNVCATILPRSGLGHKSGIVLGNLVGLIDSDYQGELMVSLWNRKNEDFTVEVGMRIAQLIFLPVLHPQFSIVEEFSDDSERGAGGFGHTGKK